jgi:hypothetical protein
MSELAEPRELSEDDFIALLEERVQAAFGMTLAQFVESLRKGNLDPEAPRVTELAMLAGARAS